MLRLPIRFDKDVLERAAQVKFDWSDIQDLVAQLTMYRERLDPDPPLPEFMWADAELQRSPAIAEREARQEFVAAVAEIWYERDAQQNRGKRDAKRNTKRNNKRSNRNRLGYYYDREPGYRHSESKGYHTGPLLELLLELFAAIGATLSPATLTSDLNELVRGPRKR
jgi:alkylated DNA repair dioxygenase AlkB